MRNLILILTFLSFVGCDKYSREDFSFERRDYLGNEIDISGYYFREVGQGQYAYCFFYKNGVVLSASTSSNILSEDDLYNHLKTYDHSQLSDLPYYWGIYKVENDIIDMECWMDIGGSPYQILKSEGEILNETTFMITWKTNTRDNKESEVEEIYKYRKFSPKPDSTNSFID